MKTPPAYCATCGKLLANPKPVGRIQRYCLLSGACRQKAYRRRLKAKRREKLQHNRLRLLSQESFEWHTPKRYINAARKVLDEIELDPASSEQANRVIQAKTFYDQAHDGLAKSWKARTVWLNPPYCKTGNTSNVLCQITLPLCLQKEEVGGSLPSSRREGGSSA